MQFWRNRWNESHLFLYCLIITIVSKICVANPQIVFPPGASHLEDNPFLNPGNQNNPPIDNRNHQIHNGNPSTQNGNQPVHNNNQPNNPGNTDSIIFPRDNSPPDVSKIFMIFNDSFYLSHIVCNSFLYLLINVFHPRIGAVCNL